MPDLDLTLKFIGKMKEERRSWGRRNGTSSMTGNSEPRAKGKQILCFPGYVQSLQICNGSFISCRFRITTVNSLQVSMGRSGEQTITNALL